jgi:hypothetical protein
MDMDKIDQRLQRIEDKLDSHLERVTKVEKDIEWLRGHLSIATSMVLGIISFLGVVLYNFLFGGK